MKLEITTMYAKKPKVEQGIFMQVYLILKKSMELLFTSVIVPLIIFKRSRKYFSFQNKNYHYFAHKYNTAWANERTVEVPIVMDYIKDFSGEDILEIGNVLSHYYHATWTILDKYEKAKGVISGDIVDYKPDNKYDLIVSISTLEHVGYDEDFKDPHKIIRAINRLKDCLKEKGEIVITLPLGYNSMMDRLLFAGKLGFDKEYYLKRISKINEWKQVNRKEIINIRYNSPFPYANGVVVGIINKGN